MAKTRKQRITEQRKLKATLTQTQNELRKAEKQSEHFRSRAFAAERRAEVPLSVPPSLMQNIIGEAVRETVRALVCEMREPVLDIRRRVDQEVHFIEQGMLVRGTDEPQMTATQSMENGDTHVTFQFPAFRWTQILDRDIQRSLLSRDGPTYMRDRDLHYAKVPDVPVRLDTADARSYRPDISHEVI